MKKPLIELIKSVELSDGAVTPPIALVMARTIRLYAGLVEDLATVVNDAIEAIFPDRPMSPGVSLLITQLTARMAAVKIVELPDVC